MNYKLRKYYIYNAIGPNHAQRIVMDQINPEDVKDFYFKVDFSIHQKVSIVYFYYK